MYIDDKINDLTLMIGSLEQQGKTETEEYKDLVKMKAILMEAVNSR